MDFLASPLGVLLILGAVTAAAFAFRPSAFVGAWRPVAKRYETNAHPSSIAFPGEDVSLNSHEITRIDAALDDNGFWMLFKQPDPRQPPGRLLIPWDCIRFKEANEGSYNFQIRLDKPIEFYVSPGLGSALKRRSQGMPGEPQM
jgi:hypothetical protein